MGARGKKTRENGTLKVSDSLVVSEHQLNSYSIFAF